MIAGFHAGRGAGWSRRLEWIAPVLLFVAAAWPRFVALDRRPLHHDEGSNAIFLLRLLDQGVYHYDPTNYHGPTLFYLSGLALAIGGLSATSLRFVPALLGSLMPPLTWGLRHELGRQETGVAALLIAWSPSFVYYSRDAIHEIYFVFLTLLLVVAATRAARTASWSWTVVAGCAAGGLVATKETAPLTLGALLLAWLASGGRRGMTISSGRLAAAGAAALTTAAAFYSGGFRTPRDLLGPFRALRPWAARALGGEGHLKPGWYFLRLLATSETSILILGAAGVLISIVAARRRSLSGLALAVWAGAMLLAYSAIPYKTPWLCLNIVLPLALLAGVAVSAGMDSRVSWRRSLAVAILGGALAASLGQALRLSLIHYDDEAEPLVYVQTRREALALVKQIESMAGRSPEGLDLPIDIVSPDYLPLNWYLRRFTRVAYHGHLVDDPDAQVIIARIDQTDEVASRLGPDFLRRDYDLRPGVRLALFARRDLWQDDTPAGSEETTR